ncbi:spore photoproduct lyase [Thermotomaculum hydrothermale]|uniref:Spore photoproduct lyase n=1 Tax=Thermotomaculum hydrothermale TaxID=981385 RepID=A0A7R6PP15_9BACT|nr:hypothetical protein [Thermotomaculum hydrothermale]BBB32661.1 spore photoproduct lyase [Thermotomaculum hydrothermale]
MIKRIFITEEAKKYPYSFEICEKAEIEPEIIPDEEYYREKIEAFLKDDIKEGKSHLVLTVFKGDFFRKCPGTRGKICCNYYVIDQTTNCPFDCSYCFLQSYLNFRAIRFAVNVEDLFSELDGILKDGRFIRIGTGELSDSLALEPITGFANKLIDFFESYPNAMLELKTKSNNVYSLPDLKERKAKVVIGWTIAPQKIIDNEEKLVASLKERLDSSRHSAHKGYLVSFHLDPIIFYPDAQSLYIEMLEDVFKIHKKLAWLSMAGFRYEPDLKWYVENRFEKSRLLDGEFVKCSDGKYRYLFPERIKFYRRLIDFVSKKSPDTPIYFCMEDKNVWELVFPQNYLSKEKMKILF